MSTPKTYKISISKHKTWWGVIVGDLLKEYEMEGKEECKSSVFDEMQILGGCWEKKTLCHYGKKEIQWRKPSEKGNGGYFILKIKEQ